MRNKNYRESRLYVIWNEDLGGVIKVPTAAMDFGVFLPGDRENPETGGVCWVERN
jgi:hypothetical protein